MELSRRDERPRFILVSLSSDVFALAALWLGNGPHLLRLIVLTYFCLAIVMFSISSFWKISMHMAGVGGFSTALVFVFGAPALWAFLSLMLVAWARLYRRKHDIPQLVAGAVAGILVTVLVFGWIGRLL
jgi:ABC-type multidrug transport system fused ATPase/permease subunit